MCYFILNYFNYKFYIYFNHKNLIILILKYSFLSFKFKKNYLINIIYLITDCYFCI